MHAKYLALNLYDPDNLRTKKKYLKWPYREGLRLDEHLTFSTDFS